MKAILISIKPKYVADILNGKKTIEIRKTCPEIFKHLKPYEGCSIDVYIYCTKTKPRAILTDKGVIVANTLTVGGNSQYKSGYSLSGKVIAKFTLNKIEEIRPLMCGNFYHKEMCLTTNELNEYLNNKTGYAWHIDNLVILDKPKELSEFSVYCYTHPLGIDIKRPLIHAPQSWCYIEVSDHD